MQKRQSISLRPSRKQQDRRSTSAREILMNMTMSNIFSLFLFLFFIINHFFLKLKSYHSFLLNFLVLKFLLHLLRHVTFRLLLQEILKYDYLLSFLSFLFLSSSRFLNYYFQPLFSPYLRHRVLARVHHLRQPMNLNKDKKKKKSHKSTTNTFRPPQHRRRQDSSVWRVDRRWTLYS